MSLLLLLNKQKISNPRQKFGKDLAFWINPALSQKTFNGDRLISQINDLSGNNKHVTQGTATYQPTYAQSGYMGLPSLYFNASNSQRMANSSFKSGGIQTLVCVLKKASGSSGAIISNGSWSSYGWATLLTDNGVNVQGYSAANNWVPNFLTPIAAKETHLAVVLDNINLKVKVYVNGVKIGNDYTMPNAYTENSNSLLIISCGQGGVNPLTSNIYNCYIVNRELTLNEILHDYRDWTRYRL